MTSAARTVEEYLAALPEDRRADVEALRAAVRAGLPEGYEEGMQYGMIGYYVPHSRYPLGYHCDEKQPLPFAAIAAQKGYYGVYLMGLYMSPGLTEWFQGAWAATGAKLDMGKACVRLKKLDGAPIQLFRDAMAKLPVDDYIGLYEAGLPEAVRAKREKKKAKL